MKRKIHTPVKTTRNVVVRVFACKRAVYGGDLVIAVPEDMDDDEVEALVQGNCESLPEPDEWDELWDDEEVETDHDTALIVVRRGDVAKPSDAELIVDEKGNAHIVT